MIRECNIDDIASINKLGILANENFTNVYNIREILDKDYEFIYVYEEDNNLLGFIQIEKHFEVLDLINIAVSEDTRRKGIASKLIQYIIDNVEHERFLLEVNSNNTSAIKLYQKFNFKEINIRKNYYSNGDAIIMENAHVDATPELSANNIDASLIHEAAIGKIAGDQLIKLMTLGLTEAEAEEQIINGFLK